MSLINLTEKIQKILNLLLYGGNIITIVLLKKESKKLFHVSSVSKPEYPRKFLENFIKEIETKGYSPKNFNEYRCLNEVKIEFPELDVSHKLITTTHRYKYLLIALTPQKNLLKNQNKLFENGIDLLIEHLNQFEEESHELTKTPFKKIKEVLKNIEPIIYSSDLRRINNYFFSGSTEELFGIPPKEIYKNRFSFMRSIYPDDFKDFKNFILSINAGKTSEVEYRFNKNKETTHFIRQTGIPIIKNDNVIRVVGIIHDITKEKELLAKLYKAEKEYNLIMKTAGGLIFILDRSGYFISMNDLGVTHLGYQRKNIIGSHFLEFIDEESKTNIAVAFKKILSQNDPVTFEANFIDNFGKTILFEIQATNLKSNNKTTGMIGSGRDITDKKIHEVKLQELNAKLTEANRIISIERERAKEKISILEEINHLKNDFISNVSHELRTPLASIVGFAETIATDQELPREMILEFNNIILNEGKRLAKLVNDILDFSKLEENRDALIKTKFDLISLTKEIVHFYQKHAIDKGILFQSEIPESEIHIEADKDRLKTAIGNLINNAIKFTSKDGKVIVTAKEFLNEVEILVSDTGIGISEDKVPLLFQKFNKIGNSHTQGVGFGLATVKKIIELHKGLIQVKSEINKGTTFIIRLPKN
jgi:PAS domain S-box-containing protein